MKLLIQNTALHKAVSHLHLEDDFELKNKDLDKDRPLPESILNEFDVGLVFHHQLPYTTEEDDWVIAAVMARQDNRIHLSSPTWDRTPLWIPENGTVYSPIPIVKDQIRQLRIDLQVSNDPDSSVTVVHPLMAASTCRAVSQLELTPPPAYGSICLITKRSSTALRQKLLAYHDPETAILTNLERRIGSALDSVPGYSGVSCVRDSANRFSLSACVAKHPDGLTRYNALQASWVGFYDRACQFFANQ